MAATSTALRQSWRGWKHCACCVRCHNYLEHSPPPPKAESLLSSTTQMSLASPLPRGLLVCTGHGTDCVTTHSLVSDNIMAQTASSWDDASSALALNWANFVHPKDLNKCCWCGGPANESNKALGDVSITWVNFHRVKNSTRRRHLILRVNFVRPGSLPPSSQVSCETETYMVAWRGVGSGGFHNHEMHASMDQIGSGSDYQLLTLSMSGGPRDPRPGHASEPITGKVDLTSKRAPLTPPLIAVRHLFPLRL